MERQTNSDKLERLATEQEREYLQRILGNFGLYDATFDLPPVDDDDDQFVRGLE